MAYRVSLTTPAETDVYAAFEPIREAAPCVRRTGSQSERCQRRGSWPVDLLAMGDAGDIDPPLGVINRIDNAIIPDPDTPALLITLQFLASGRSRVFREFA